MSDPKLFVIYNFDSRQLEFVSYYELGNSEFARRYVPPFFRSRYNHFLENYDPLRAWMVIMSEIAYNVTPKMDADSFKDMTEGIDYGLKK